MRNLIMIWVEWSRKGLASSEHMDSTLKSGEGGNRKADDSTDKLPECESDKNLSLEYCRCHSSIAASDHNSQTGPQQVLREKCTDEGIMHPIWAISCSLLSRLKDFALAANLKEMVGKKIKYEWNFKHVARML